MLPLALMSLEFLEPSWNVTSHNATVSCLWNSPFQPWFCPRLSILVVRGRSSFPAKTEAKFRLQVGGKNVK